ncbi:MAG: type II toxin-antitoxin system VapC family toxin [Candidatus Promineifilaceae bacterium]
MQFNVFVDTAAWIALLNKDDKYHQDARRVMQMLQQQQAYFITSEFVLLEVADALSSPAIRPKTIGFINGLRNLPRIEIVAATNELIADAWELYSARLDKEWGLTDCTSFVIMRQQKITQAFTSDHHFSQARFSKLM